MKALTLLSVLAYSSYVFASNSYISDLKLKEFELDYEKNKAQSSLIKNAWIAPINLNYSYQKNNSLGSKNSYENASINIVQPIFQSGGIFYGIEYAKSLKEFSNYLVDIDKKKMQKNIVSLLIEIKQLGLKIKKQNLQIINAKLDLNRKKEQYLNGEIDSSFLDNAIIRLNSITLALYDMQNAKENLISNLKSLTKLDYKDVNIPHLKKITKDEFLKNNLILNMQNAKKISSKNKRDMVVAKYLPRISLLAGYNWSKTPAIKGGGYSEVDYYNYGVSINIPLNINALADIESSKIDTLKDTLLIQDRKLQLESLYDKVTQNLKNIEKKQSLSLKNIEIYRKLLSDTKKLFSGGYKTQSDVNMLQNSLNISKMDYEIFKLDRELELLNLYEMVKNEI
jgi:outer membrane protein TolC